MANPSGQRLDDGYSTKIEFPLDSTIGLWEKEVQAPGFDGGEAIDTTTMRNNTLRTFNPQSLQTMTPGTFKVAYDEGHYLRIRAMINKNQFIKVIFPTGRPLEFWGYLKSFIPDALVIGQQPTATIVIQPTNQDNTHTEAAPTLGTTTSTTTTTTTTT